MYEIRYLRVFDYVSLSLCATGPARESEVYPKQPQMEKKQNAPITVCLLGLFSYIQVSFVILFTYQGDTCDDIMHEILLLSHLQIGLSIRSLSIYTGLFWHTVHIPHHMYVDIMNEFLLLSHMSYMSFTWVSWLGLFSFIQVSFHMYRSLLTCCLRTTATRASTSWGYKRERERERKKERQTDRKKDRKKERQKERKIEKKGGKAKKGKKKLEVNRHIDICVRHHVIS